MKKQENFYSLNDSQLNGLQIRFPVLTKLFIGWVYPLILLAKHKHLELFDIPTTPEMKDSYSLFKQYQVQFVVQSESKNALLKSLLYTFRKQLRNITIWQLFMISAQLSTPLLIKLIIEEKQSKTQDKEYLLCLIVLITFSRFVFMVSQNQSKYQMRLLGLDAQNTISVALLQKSLRISFLSNNNFTSASVINLLSVDAAKLSYVTYYLFVVLIQPILLIYTLILIFIFIGTPFIVGLFVAILSTLINLYLGKIIQRKQKNVLEIKDERTKLTNYIFSFIKFIKINALEQFFIDKLFQLRIKEILAIQLKSTIQAWSIFSSWTSPLLILIATFATIIYTDNDLTTSTAFVIISLFQMIQSPLIAIPQALAEILQVNVSVKKLQRFLFTNELMEDCIIQTPDTQRKNCVNIRDGNFYWPGRVFMLQNLNLAVHDKEFVAIVGDVGSGKSSLLYALLGEMLFDDQTSQISIQGSMAYVGQNGWLMNDTVRQNILFGSQFDKDRYEEVIEITCLQQDLKILIKGDQTMVGERGVNLSGGQKIRICLARAIYSRARILLLDDPLSALDNYVCQQIMQNALSTYLKNTIRILVTHKIQLLYSVDQIYVLKQGSIIEQGPQSQAQFQSQVINNQEQKQIEDKQIPKQTEENELLLNEDREISNINPIVYKSYLSENGNNCFFLKLLLIQIMWILCYVGCLFTLAQWSQNQFDDQKHDSQYFIQIYVALSFSQAIFTYLRPYSLVSHCIDFTHKLHNSMINQLIRAGQCEFFERVPVGRILNRFTKDLTVIDTEIYWSISWICSQLSLLIGNIIIYLYSSSLWILLPITIYVYVCYLIQKLFTNASTQLQRIESITKSPILSFFQECISNGLTSIRAYNKQKYTTQKFCQFLDTNRKVGIVLNATSGWFAIILGTASLVLNTIAILLCIFYFESSASKIVLLLTFATTLDQNISDGVQAISRFQLNMVAYERCLEFTKIIMEKDEGLDLLNNQWPKLGQIEFKDYSVRYRDGLNTALAHVNLTIEANDKIGIVGRTGAGKSTFTLALMRLLNPFEGHIEIDGVDIRKVPLTLLRTKVSLIMQDACLFTGTLRENLDPFTQHQDQFILEILNQCCLQRFHKNREGLNTQIQEGGKNLSEGEKQLICIARAVLRQTKIILIDEGTSNLDNQTEEIVQATIQKMFAECTVLTIAHRLQTIKNCNKIIVIEEGEVVEFDETQILLENESSKFYMIYKEAN